MPFRDAFAGKTVLITGHTGFKGSWLSIWLRELGADVVGYSIAPPTEPSNFVLAQVEKRITHVHGDVRDLDRLCHVVGDYKPDVVFHLAAQPIVLTSFEQPVYTLDTNVMGTVNHLEALRRHPGARAAVFITTDKVYEDQHWLFGYRETDRLGGFDPYSASKAMAELAINSYRQSFFSAPDSLLRLASTRAGNVIGGGDLADFRLVPDCMRALMADEPIAVRNPDYVRPWQNVLEALSGYLWLAVRLMDDDGADFAEAWNFGPREIEGVTAREIAEQAIEYWGSGSWYHVDPNAPRKKETYLLRLSWEKAAHRLGWQPAWSWQEAVRQSVDYFKALQAQQQAGDTPDLYPVCAEHIAGYTRDAAAQGLPWAL